MVSPKVEKIQQDRRRESLLQWSATPPRLRTEGTEHSLFAAQAGAVKTLLLRIGEVGVEEAPEMERSLEEIALETLRHGGEVIAVDQPMVSNPLAILRYALTFPRDAQSLRGTDV